MPLYEYQCSACAHRFERIVKFSDAPLKTCPQCGKQTVEQLISAPAIQFKGSGWYVNDYARKGSAPAAPSSTKSEGGSDSVSAGKESGSGNAGSSAPANSGSSEKSSGSASSSSTGGDSGGSSAKSNTKSSPKSDSK
jgi:putative FmdB family regulatory protein